MSEIEEMIPAKKKKLVVIDGKSVFYRGYYAMPNLSTKDGTPTGGVFGFASMALEVLKRLKPDYVAVAWDKPKTNIRKRLEMYPEYKAGRKPAPPDFYEQVPILHELLQAFGWPLYELDDYEADDIMGTLAVKATAADIETLVVTSDMDVLQLVDSHVHAFLLKKGLSNIELYSPKSFEAKYGLRVDQFIDLKALKGDSSDNIPGVPGIGEKTAIQLLQDHQTLDGIYENIDLIKETVRKKLVAGKDLAYLSKKLGAIWLDAPVDLDLASLAIDDCEPLRVAEILRRLEFRSLLRQLPEVMQVPVEADGSIAVQGSFDIGKLPGNNIVDNKDSLQKLADELNKTKQLVIHGRAGGKHGRQPQVLIVSPSPANIFTLKLDSLGYDLVKDTLAAVFADKAVAKVGHDLKATLQMCYELGLEVNGITHDTQIAAFLLNALRRDFSLTELAAAELDYEVSPFEEGSDEDVVMRASEIMAVIRALMDKQVIDLQDMPKIAQLAHDIEWPVIPVLARMEYEGIQLDTGYLKKFQKELDELISDYEKQIYEHAGQKFNIGSPSQLADILFEKLQMSTVGIKKGKTGFSTAANELDKLRGQHPIIDLVTHYREVTKLKNTYVDTLPKQVDDNSRLHTTFSLTVAQTGRLSSNDPNLQNIPTRTDLGKRIRTAFVAGKGNVLVSADYSQFELRLAAVLADDKELISIFNKGADIHTATAAQVYERQPEDVTKQMRSAAKTINFGVLYGMSPHGLSAATGMTFGAAKQFIDKYFELRKPILDYMNALKEKARTEGYVETLFGRRRPMPDIKSSNFMVRQGAERQAMNMPIQGTEADLMKMAMIQVDEKLAALDGAKQLLQIHDSILVECKESDSETIAKLLQDTMENVYKLPVRLDVDVSTGKNWGEL